ncbi:LYR motif-containing protein 4 isoform X1 [Myotis daubentonii]|uniref:LYR motif-containing protein 4 isoform X1 n=1 Tax=Myotis daubentonii TaxID=98922 RepID=UPI0028733C9A|nr:LYR motif-containing protein 4 isoform X1 [Myotis daubentonii]
MAASSRARVLDLYRAMLRESKQFSAYNYRTYAIRKIRDAFRENKNMKDPVEIQALVNKAKRDLEMIRRQNWPKFWFPVHIRKVSSALTGLAQWIEHRPAG